MDGQEIQDFVLDESIGCTEPLEMAKYQEEEMKIGSSNDSNVTGDLYTLLPKEEVTHLDK